MKFEDIFRKQVPQHLTGEQIMDKLSTCAKKLPVVFAFRDDEYHSGIHYPVNKFASWRGSYDLPTCYTDGNTVYTVKELLKVMKEFFNSTQWGYKGGAYKMYKGDELWADGYGSYSGNAVVDVIECEDCVAFVVEKREY